MLDYIAGFREAYQYHASSVPAEHLNNLGMLTVLNHGHAVCFLSRRYGAGVEFVPEPGIDELRIEEHRTISQMAFPAAADGPGAPGILLPPDAQLEIHNAHIVGAYIEVTDARVFVYLTRFTDGLPCLLRGRKAEATLALCLHESQGKAEPLGWMYLCGDNSDARWTRQAGERDAALSLMRALSEINLRSERAVLSRLGTKGVLVLGKFDPAGRGRIEKIRQALQILDYETFTAEDFKDMPYQSVNVKVQTLISMARFVVVDDSDDGGQLAEIQQLSTAATAAAILRLQGYRPSGMSRSVGGPFSAVDQYTYTPANLQSVVTEAARSAEDRLDQISKYLLGVEKWRDEYGTESRDQWLPFGFRPWIPTGR